MFGHLNFKKDLMQVWLDLNLGLIGETLSDNMDDINGISTNPKLCNKNLDENVQKRKLNAPLKIIYKILIHLKLYLGNLKKVKIVISPNQ